MKKLNSLYLKHRYAYSTQTSTEHIFGIKISWWGEEQGEKMPKDINEEKIEKLVCNRPLDYDSQHIDGVSVPSRPSG